MSFQLAESPFYSIQGEGPLSGMPAVFLRFSKCVLNCPYCDSKYAWSTGKQYDNESDLVEIQDFIDETNTKNLIITGGEPLLNMDYNDKNSGFCDLLMWAKYKRKLQVSWETTFIPNINLLLDDTITFDKVVDYIHKQLYLPILDQIIVISPKIDRQCYPVPISLDHLCRYYDMSRLSNSLLENIYYKIVYQEQYHDDILKFINELNYPTEKIFIMPITHINKGLIDMNQYNLNCKQTIEFCKSTGLRYSPRIHIDVYGAQRGV